VGITIFLYKAPKTHKGIHEDGDESFAIGKPEIIKKRVMDIFPRIEGWSKYENDLVHPSYNYPLSYNSIVNGNCEPNNEYIDISLMENGDGYIHIIDVTKGSSKLIRRLYEEFEFQYIWEMQSCKLIDPYSYNEN